MVRLVTCVDHLKGRLPMITITINNEDYDVLENISVLEACKQLDINIPTLCYDDRLEAESNCNLCIVVNMLLMIHVS